MVQGKTKGLQQKGTNNVRHTQKAAANPKKGRRTVAPKKAAAVKQAAMHKVRAPTCPPSETPALTRPHHGLPSDRR